MDLRDLQSALNARGWTPPLALDGEWGPATDKAVADLLTSAGVAFEAWPPARRALAAKQAPPAKPSPLQPRPQPFPQLAAATRRLEMDLHPRFPQHVFDEAQVTTQTDAVVPTDQVHARHRKWDVRGSADSRKRFLTRM